METKRSQPASFGAWLESQLLRREWSRSDFARRLGTRSATVSRWILGVRTPDPESCEKIADVLFVDVDEVLTIAGHRPRLPKDKLEQIHSEIDPYLRKITWNPVNRLDLISNLQRIIKMQEMEAGTRSAEDYDAPVVLDDEEE